MSNRKLNKLVLDAAEAISYNVESANDYLHEEGINIDQYVTRGFKELNFTEKTQPKKELSKSQSFFRRAVLAAKIAHEYHNEWAFGAVKFQKLVYLSEQVCNMKFISDYRKQAAGPMDHKFIHSIKREFEKLGYIVLRTAGSHGFADLIAIEIREKRIIFIQCKPNNFSKKKEIELNQEYEFINNEYQCEFKVI